MLRDTVETPQVLQGQNAMQVILNVYVWLGLKLPDFVAAQMQFSEIEELRSIGIKYLESTHLFTE